MTVDFMLSSYMFDLPEGQIAQNPAALRGTSRLLVLDHDGGVAHDGTFPDILQFLPERCLLVVNNSRVIPARLHGTRASGGKVEFLLLTPLPLITPEALKGTKEWYGAEVEGLLRSSKQIKAGEQIQFGEHLYLELLERGEFGRCRVQLCWQGELAVRFTEKGELPLPPYIRRAEGNSKGLWGSDHERYQTVYGRDDKAGSVAAPTAGLHFTPELKDALLASGREWVEVTLYVGYGTFSPVRCDDIREHPMHEEYVELGAAAIEAICRAKAEGRAVIAVGTTSARVLEGVALHLQFKGETPLAAPAPQSSGKTIHAEVSRGGDALACATAEHTFLRPYAGWINIFLYPGKELRIIDGLITNFHLPGSSLLMLVSALAGRARILDAYDYAVQHNFRFFSYGDAMLIR